jgi:hypothetical protein
MPAIRPSSDVRCAPHPIEGFPLTCVIPPLTAWGTAPILGSPKVTADLADRSSVALADSVHTGPLHWGEGRLPSSAPGHRLLPGRRGKGRKWVCSTGGCADAGVR